MLKSRFVTVFQDLHTAGLRDQKRSCLLKHLARKIKSNVNQRFNASLKMWHDINDLNLENNAWCIERLIDIAFYLSYRRFFMEWMWFTFFSVRFIRVLSLKLAKPGCFHTILMLIEHCTCIIVNWFSSDFMT